MFYLILVLQLITLIGLFFGKLIIGHFFPAYAKQKGENLATKEDIKDITNKIEEVRIEYSKQLEGLRHQNALILEQGRQRHQLQLAALDKRLEIHQQAFTLWVELKFSVYKDNIHEVVYKCQEWWEHNCLYLDKKVSDAFLAAYRSAANHKELVDSRSEVSVIKENWEAIELLGKIIFESVKLPSIAGYERVPVKGVEAQMEVGTVKVKTES